MDASIVNKLVPSNKELNGCFRTFTLLLLSFLIVGIIIGFLIFKFIFK